MQLWADVYDATNTTKQGEGPIELSSVDVQRVLDGPGRVSVNIPDWNQRAIDLLTAKRVMRVYIDGPESDELEKRQLTAFVIDKVRRQDAGSKTLTVSGKDLLSVLRNKLTGLGRTYTTQDGRAIISDLLGLAGWTVNAATMGNTAARFDRANILKAIQRIVDEKGWHFRLDSTTANKIELGLFGDDSGIVVANIDHIARDVYANDDLLVIDSIGLASESGDIANAILPLGAGDGDSALTIEKSTRGRATVRTGGDGRDEYWLEDATSISTYGRIEKAVDLSKISPITNSSSDVEAAATAVDDAAWTWLQRNKEPRVTYAVSCRKVARVPEPGDKVTLDYRGEIIARGDTPIGDTTAVDKVRGEFYVIAVSERWGVGGGSVSLELSSVDEVNDGDNDILVGAIEAVEVQGVAVKPYPFVSPYTYVRQMANGFPAGVPIDITDAVMDLFRCRIRFVTRPFRVNASGAASGGGATSSAGGGATSSGGGNHNHRVLALTSPSGFPSTSPRPYLGRQSDGGANLFVRLETNIDADFWTESSSGAHTHTVPAHTHSLPNHTHNLTYAINDDTSHPEDIEVWINGVDQTSALGGPWATGGNVAINEVIEISDILKSGTLQQLHNVEFRCGAGQGEIEVTVELYGVMQSINV